MSITFFAEGGSNEMNVASANFRKIMGILGLDGSPDCGSFKGEDLTDLHRRIERALHLILAGVGDSGTPGTDRIYPSGVRMIDCGLQPGYFEDRLATLLQIVEDAERVDGAVIFS